MKGLSTRRARDTPGSSSTFRPFYPRNSAPLRPQGCSHVGGWRGVAPHIAARITQTSYSVRARTVQIFYLPINKTSDVSVRSNQRIARGKSLNHACLAAIHIGSETILVKVIGYGIMTPAVAPSKSRTMDPPLTVERTTVLEDPTSRSKGLSDVVEIVYFRPCTHSAPNANDHPNNGLTLLPT